MKRFIPDSFEKQILLSFFAVGWVPVGLALLFTSVLSKRNLMESESAKVLTRTDQVASDLQNYFDELETLIKVIKSDPLLNDSSTSVNAKFLELGRQVEINPEIIDITLHDTPSPLHSNFNGINVQLPFSISTSAPVLRWWTKLDNGHQWLEVKTSLSQVWKRLDTITFPPNGSVALVSETGLILSHREKELIHQHLPISKIDQKSKTMPGQNWSQFFTFTKTFDSKKLKSDLNFTLVSFLPKSIVYQKILKQQLFNSMIGLLISLLSVAFGRKLSKNLAAHLSRAANVSSSVSTGDLDARIPEKGPSEIVTLAQSFNQMVNKLQSHQQDLENTVAIRTDHLEKTAALLQAAHNASKDGLWLAYKDGSNHSQNETFAEMFELPKTATSKSSEIAQHIGQCFVQKEQFHQWIEQAIQKPQEAEVLKWKLTNSKIFSIYAAPVINSSDELIAVLFAFTDLTKEVRLHQELSDMRSMETIGQLSASVAHEFNNLLTKVSGNLQLMLESQQSAIHETELNEALNSSLRAADLVRGMLSFSQQNWMQFNNLSIERVIDDTLKKIDTQLIGSIELKFNYPSVKIPNINADRERLTEAIYCLLENAIQELSGSGQITVSVAHLPDSQDHEHGLVEIQVQDNGSGINQTLRSKMYQPFISSSKKRRGLGLAVCHGIIEQHNGKLNCIKSGVDGTIFQILIPAIKPSKQTIPPKNQTTTSSNDLTTAHHSHKKKIMVVDDDEGVRRVTSISLKRGGFKVEAFDSGSSALDYYQLHHQEICLIILDLRMPEMMGTEVLAQIRERFEYVPVIICSGFLGDLDEIKETTLEVEALLEKPVSPSKLLETVGNAIST